MESTDKVSLEIVLLLWSNKEIANNILSKMSQNNGYIDTLTTLENIDHEKEWFNHNQGFNNFADAIFYIKNIYSNIGYKYKQWNDDLTSFLASQGLTQNPQKLAERGLTQQLQQQQLQQNSNPRPQQKNIRAQEEVKKPVSIQQNISQPQSQKPVLQFVKVQQPQSIQQNNQQFENKKEMQNNQQLNLKPHQEKWAKFNTEQDKEKQVQRPQTSHSQQQIQQIQQLEQLVQTQNEEAKSLRLELNLAFNKILTLKQENQQNVIDFQKISDQNDQLVSDKITDNERLKEKIAALEQQVQLQKDEIQSLRQQVQLQNNEIQSLGQKTQDFKKQATIKLQRNAEMYTEIIQDLHNEIKKLKLQLQSQQRSSYTNQYTQTNPKNNSLNSSFSENNKERSKSAGSQRPKW